MVDDGSEVDGHVMRGRSVLVTGSSGFVGSWLCRRLVDEGARVVAFDWTADPHSEFARSRLRERVASVTGDLRDYAVLARTVSAYEPEVVFHLGAQTLVQRALRAPLETFESNVRGTYYLLEACRTVGSVRSIVVASSDKAYGTLHGELYGEDDPLRGDHPYDVSKSCTDLIARSYSVTYGLPVVVVRCGNIYGGGDLNWSRIVPGTIRSLWHGEAPIIRSTGDLVREYLHVDDVVSAYLRAAAAAEDGLAGEAFNFGSGEHRTALEVAHAIGRLMERSDLAPIVRGTAKAEIHTQALDWSKARRLLGWRPRIPFDEGLRASIAWYEELFRHAN